MNKLYGSTNQSQLYSFIQTETNSMNVVSQTHATVNWELLNWCFIYFL